MKTKTTSLFSKEFNLLLLCAFFFFISFNLIIPELPAYLDSMGGEAYKGLIISLFTLTAALSRPFSGKLTDTFSRKYAIVFGAFVCMVVNFLYPLSFSIFFFLMLRLLHGMSTGFNPTGVSAYVADIVPIERRGEAMGYLGFFCSIGMAVGPMIGSWTKMNYDINTMFYTAGVFSLLTFLISLSIKDSTKQQRLTISNFKEVFQVSTEDFFDKKVIPVAIVMILCEFSFGIILTIIPDFSDFIGIKDKSTYFTIYVLSSVVVRVLAGKVSDKYGRVPVLFYSLLVSLFAMLILSFSTGVTSMVISAIILGFGLGTASPTLFAWTVDLSDKNKLGRGFSTMFIALEIGIGLGALISGTLYNSKIQNFSMIFGIGCVMFFLSIVYVFWYKRNKSNSET
ncbi:MAG: MFS transporter [Flavobacteriales bacterium]